MACYLSFSTQDNMVKETQIVMSFAWLMLKLSKEDCGSVVEQRDKDNRLITKGDLVRWEICLGFFFTHF